MQRHGAHLLDATSARFALWAPDARSVSLQLEQQPAVELLPEADGWFTGLAPCQAGDRYRYRIDDTLQVPDPASRYQPEGVQGPSQVVDTASYPWRHPWQGRPWHEAVIQELHVGLLGGYAGVMRELPRLAEIGITAIELMPLGAFPGTRNWGYDGVLPFAPQHTYGSPTELCRLIDEAHGHGLMVLLDVVYNHFGPDGNYLHQYASTFFREDRQTPWGAAIDFRRPQVREFFIQNALMWLCDYRFDGLRLDAVHAIDQPDFLIELAQRVRAAVAPGRQVWLVLENEHNQASLLEQGFDAQWNDDGHNALHVLLTGETEGYYADYKDRPIEKLARSLSEGFVFQGQANRHGTPRGEPSGHLAPSAFVLFLQNHDQIGNRAMGERLTRLCPPPALRAATGLLLLAPMIPLLFMGDEEGSRRPFLFFTDHHDELADAVREGRRAEFAHFAAFADPAQRERIPDPNAQATFDASQLAAQEVVAGWHGLYQRLLTLRRLHLTPRLPGSRALGATVLGERALTARWRLGDGSQLRIDLNLASEPQSVALPPVERWLFDSSDTAHLDTTLPAHSCVVSLLPPDQEAP
ncbi:MULTISPECIES: malto-oligosyltrehalose trehalohydrolase [Pseudomonas]|uniref:Malto-oligosyltrehalose trehalohydrolase n=1 Tax=Pseudomonas putida TaxID=303 RepID=A0A6S5D656_PSEPU|nr:MULTISPECIES: malto-oligosyltrehalose trehalohydrolase [Pseudomonas]MCO7623719.1 malto-oligosyltrehalose trehalohydrolase [Pseudomonas guariconensis]MDM9594870.1 malto-oligosyltrehalose trehalohydrolase [Pseudomonas guariconensis]MDM9607701.1 malto-oligosyltrehalose trehalohydrolase [Pseudomonas guariconensis]MDM9612658.1 malto-oligosyltrehalose trehalohydrolase [Pseudomonas guariconensis]URD41049.1 malto-oligosyltrehalose trehalohydrolase [Pseudomonas sp. BYT-5]